MGYRRSPASIAAYRAWRRFVEANAPLVRQAGLPPGAVASVTDWDDFLMHGYLARDPGRFSIDALAPAQYACLVQLAANYFAAGYEFYSPMALNLTDQDMLRARFDVPG